jgi:hypothetical protein
MSEKEKVVDSMEVEKKEETPEEKLAREKKRSI